MEDFRPTWNLETPDRCKGCTRLLAMAALGEKIVTAKEEIADAATQEAWVAQGQEIYETSDPAYPAEEATSDLCQAAAQVLDEADAQLDTLTQDAEKLARDCHGPLLLNPSEAGLCMSPAPQVTNRANLN